MTEVRIRKRAPAPVVQLRERPFDPYAWTKPVTNAVVERKREPPLPPPDSWPSGSAMLRGHGTPGYKKHIHMPGMDEEDNANLIGRSMIRGNGTMLSVWKRTGKNEYKYLGTAVTTSEAFAMVRA